MRVQVVGVHSHPNYPPCENPRSAPVLVAQMMELTLDLMYWNSIQIHGLSALRLHHEMTHGIHL